MAGSDEWSIVFYRDAAGNSPVRELLESLDLDAQQAIGWAIDQLVARNIRAREPLVRHLEDKLWELRRQSRTNIYRVIYFFFTGRKIVLVHGFQKKTQKTPRQEIDTARARYRSFVEQEGGE